MKEFTGERVIPGEVDTDLWNEHLARYAFAQRLTSWKRVLEIACGTGYGTSYLATASQSIIGIDISHEALQYATSHFESPNLHYLAASATALPFPDHHFDLVIAYEVIEHLSGWERLLAEAHRVLTPSGQLILSTPNKEYYAESRKQSGPNPYHAHEFTFEEFRAALQAVFPHVSIFLQNHADGIVFHPLAPGGATSLHVESTAADPATAHFFLAVCAGVRQTGAPTFVFLPTAANVLREREHHIHRLEGELALKDSWLASLKAEHEKMVALFREQDEALEASNRWAASLKEQVSAREAELEAAQQSALKLIAERDRAVDLLHEAEQTVEERTAWALGLDSDLARLREELTRIHDSRWLRLGRTLGLGPGARKK